MTTRKILLTCLRAALDAVDGRRAVREELARRPLHGHWHVVAVGKAAAAMAQGAVEALGAQIELAAGYVKAIAPDGGLIVVATSTPDNTFPATAVGWPLKRQG